MSEMPDPAEIATRLAVVMSTAMNLSALVADESALAAFDPAELRSLLGSLVDDLRWLRALPGTTQIQGISWPADADARIASLDSDVTAWIPGEPIPHDVVVSARRALDIWDVAPRA